MAPRKNARRSKSSVESVVVTDLEDGLVDIQAVNRSDVPAIAGRLLAAGDPGAVRTITSPPGWRVPTGIAQAAGYLGKEK